MNKNDQPCSCGLCVPSFVDAVVVEAEQTKSSVIQNSRVIVDEMVRRVVTPVAVQTPAFN